MLEPWAEVKVPGLEDQDKPWNKVTVWPGGGGAGMGSHSLPWGNGNSGRFHSGLCNGFFLKPLAFEYVCSF